MPKKYLTKKHCKEFARIHSDLMISYTPDRSFLEEIVVYGRYNIESSIIDEVNNIESRMFKSEAEERLGGSQQIIDYVRANFEPMSNEEQLTPMSELIEYYDKIKNEYKDHPYTVLTLLEEKMQSLLPKEALQNIEAFNDGYRLAAEVMGGIQNPTAPPFVAERRFNETFKTESDEKG